MLLIRIFIMWIPPQLETLKSKDGLLAVIDELEKITPLLKEAAAAEVSLGIAAAEAKTKAKAERRAEREREAAAGGETADADKVCPAPISCSARC